MRKTLIITLATVVLVVLASATALFTLAAFAGEHGTCGVSKPAELRQADRPRVRRRAHQARPLRA